MATKNNTREQAKAARSSAITLCVVVLMIVILSCIALFGFGHGFMVRYMKSWGAALNYGLDVRGGISATYQAKKNADNAGSFDDYRANTVSVLESRLTAKDVSDAKVTTLGTDRIRVELPNTPDSSNILRLLATPARVEFKDSQGNVLLGNKDVQSVTSTTAEEKPVLSFTVTADGAKKLKDAAGQAADQPISVVIDGVVVSPTITPTATDSYETVQTAEMPLAQASESSMLIKTGALPMDIVQTEMSAVAATLGANALSGMAWAGFIAGVLIFLFLLWRYRMAGAAAGLALVVHALLVFFILAVTGANISLLGVAGIVLGIGMAIDADVLIFERFRKEIMAGKQPSAVMRINFRSAFSTVFNTSITLIIMSLVLMQFGNDAVRSFGLTLLVSMLCAMITVSVVMRILLNLLVNLGVKDTKYYLA